jgi:hypothetical protein
LLTDTYRHPNPAGETGRPVVLWPMSAVTARVAACFSAAVAQIAVLFAYRLRAPPKLLGHGHSSSDSSRFAMRRSLFLPQSSPFQHQPSDLQAAMLLARMCGPVDALIGPQRPARVSASSPQTHLEAEP